MSKLTGVISAVKDRTGTSRSGKAWKVINIKLGDDWFGAYTDRVPAGESVQEGDTVAIEWESNGKFKNFTALDIISKGSTTTSADGVTKSTSQADREWHISLGAGFNQAVRVVDSMLRNEVLTLPSAKAKKYDAYMEYVKQVATELAEFNFFSTVPDPDEGGEEGEGFVDDDSSLSE